jgi:hypothetical protein
VSSCHLVSCEMECLVVPLAFSPVTPQNQRLLRFRDPTSLEVSSDVRGVPLTYYTVSRPRTRSHASNFGLKRNLPFSHVCYDRQEFSLPGFAELVSWCRLLHLSFAYLSQLRRLYCSPRNSFEVRDIGFHLIALMRVVALRNCSLMIKGRVLSPRLVSQLLPSVVRLPSGGF